MYNYMDIQKVELQDLASCICEYSICKLSTASKCLIITFDGVADNKHRSNYYYMSAMVAAGIKAWWPRAVVIDLTNLKYDFGDDLWDIVPERVEHCAFVVSDLNRESITSLFNEIGNYADGRLFDSVVEAVNAIDQQIIATMSKDELERLKRTPEEQKLHDDLAFLEQLGPERPDVPCKINTCTHGAISLSVFCRRHHFEMLEGRECPKLEDSE